MKANLKEQSKRAEITFEVERDEESGWLTASWDAPRRKGGITTQGKDLRELEQNVREAVRCHFENGKLPGRIRCRTTESSRGFSGSKGEGNNK